MTSVSEQISGSTRRGPGVGSRPSVGAKENGDELLWSRIRSGDRDAFAALVRAEHAHLRRFGAAMMSNPCEGDDVAQRALLDLWAERATTTPRGSLRAHLLVRVRHLCLTRLRSSRRAGRWERAVAEEPHTPPPTPLDELHREHHRQERECAGARVAQLVDGLDDDARTAIWMRFAGGASFEEIGEALGRPPHAVRALVYRQLAGLRRRLEEEST